MANVVANHLLLRLSTKANAKCPPVFTASDAPVELPDVLPMMQQEMTNNPANNVDPRYATMMILKDYSSWIVLLRHSSGVRVSQFGKGQTLFLIRTVGLTATVSVNMYTVQCRVTVDNKCQFQHSYSNDVCTVDARVVGET